MYEPLHTHISHRFDSQLQTIGIIPSLGLSKDGTRIGFGKGFYDRYLVRFSNIIKVAPQFSHSILEQIPADIWDIPMDFIISEKEVIDLSK